MIPLDHRAIHSVHPDTATIQIRRMADFSHLYKLRPEMLGKAHARGVPIPDSDFLDAYRQVDPPLLPELETSAIVRILRPARGRPPKQTPSREQLVGCVLQIDRPDVPPPFVAALAARLSREKGLAWVQLYVRERRVRERKWRRCLMRLFSKEFYDLQDDRPFIIHEILGRIDVPRDPTSRSERALVMTRTVMRDRLGMAMHSIATMRNIISQENNSGPFS